MQLKYQNESSMVRFFEILWRKETKGVNDIDVLSCVRYNADKKAAMAADNKWKDVSDEIFTK